MRFMFKGSITFGGTYPVNIGKPSKYKIVGLKLGGVFLVLIGIEGELQIGWGEPEPESK